MILEQGIESATTANVDVKVYAAEMKGDEIGNGVGALDGPFVTVECVEEPWVVLLNEVTRGCVGPEDVLADGRMGGTGFILVLFGRNKAIVVGVVGSKTKQSVRLSCA